MINIMFYSFICIMWFFIFKSIEKQTEVIKALLKAVELALLMFMFLYMHYNQYLPEIISLCNIMFYMLLTLLIVPRKVANQIIKIRETSK